MEVIRVENLSKLYDLGQVGTGTISKDLNRWWASVRGKEDPYARIGQTNDRTKKSSKDESVWALQEINFSVQQGEVVGIIGRNGAGKSTLLKIISRITTPTKGAVKIRGRIASLLEVGTGFHPEMTGRENIFMNGTLLGMTRREIQSKLDEIIDFAGVALYIDTPVKRYSSGMQVRLAFAVAAFLEPEILIVDEVLAVGDAEFQKKAIGRMKEVSSGDGRTVLFVSHNLAAVTELCGTCHLFNFGKLVFSGTTDNTIKQYLEIGSSIDGKYTSNKVNEIFIKEAFVFGDTNDKPRRSFSINENIFFYIEVNSTLIDIDVNIGIAMLDNYGRKIFTDVLEIKKLKFGSTMFKATVPSDFFMPGNYSFDVAIFQPNIKLYDYVESVTNFTFEDTGFSLSKYSSKESIGIIRVKCSWNEIQG